MPNIAECLNEAYDQYLTERIGEAEAKKVTLFSVLSPTYINNAIQAVESLPKQYDLGIELARDGMWLGFMFSLYDFPIKTVKMSRNGDSAIWQPIGDLKEEDIKDKRLILLDNDVITGRTIKKAVEELGKYSPKFMDLLLIYEVTRCSIGNYKAWRRYGLPEPKEIWNDLEVISSKETKDGLEITYPIGEHAETLVYDDSNIINLNTRRNVPKGVRKIMTLERDFNGSPIDLSKLEERISMVR